MRREYMNVSARLGVLVLSGALALSGLLASPALSLSNGRSYEMVSPPYKGGYSANLITAVAPDGESAAFISSGAFAGTLANPVGGAYLARRGASGWSTAPLEPPASIAPFARVGGPEDYSATLSSSVSTTELGTNLGQAEQTGTESEYLLHGSDAPYDAAGFELAGTVLKRLDGKHSLPPAYEGASADLSHLVFEGDDLLPEAGSFNNVLDELASSDTGVPELRLVGLDNEGNALGNGCEVTKIASNSADRFNAVTADGSSVFFSAYRRSCKGQLFARLGGKRTIEISKPLSEECEEVPCRGAGKREPAGFAGASEDGSIVYFATSSSLVESDKDNQNDLYVARIGCPASGPQECEVAQRVVTSLARVSGTPNGEAADVQGVVGVSPDGSRAYFVAKGVLSEGVNPEGGVPVRGADNLYTYDTASGNAPAFIASLCSGPEGSGEVEDQACPPGLKSGPFETGNDTDLWHETGPEAQTAGRDGGFLVFSSFGRLTAGDSDAARDIYRYDALTGDLERVSIGEAGADSNGNNSSYDASIANEGLSSASRAVVRARLASRAVSEDGSQIVFTSAEPLSSAAVNGLENVYEWRADPGTNTGSVSLVSTGSSLEADSDPVITPSGRDVFFLTAQSLVSQDTDSALDVYDARIGGGFAPALLESQPCSGDACQGPLTNPAPLLVAGSIAQAPGGNYPAQPAPKKVVKQKSKPKPSKKHKKTKRKGKGKASARSGKAPVKAGRRVK